MQRVRLAEIGKAYNEKLDLARNTSRQAPEKHGKDNNPKPYENYDSLSDMNDSDSYEFLDLEPNATDEFMKRKIEDHDDSWVLV
ncbi:hypothetical protein NHQ30_011267 [Ciborinia camelliae]|nr:hypothetical protein NHQ30_011267 [Ciborinia camelliae]